jgi:hypothetical protein
MLLKRIIATVIISILLLYSGTICGAIYEERIVSSAEEIVAFWENLLSNNLSIVIYNPELKYWHVNRLVLVNRSLDFDIKKTDSIVTPYQLTIRLSFNRWHNRHSPNANSDYEYENRVRGFKTADDAMASTGNSDFEEAKYTYVELISRKLTILYVLKNKTWILKGGNDHFDAYIGQHISDVNNAHLFKNVLSVPIK